MANQSLRKKLLLWLLLPLLCLIVIDSSILYRIAMNVQRKAFDHELLDSANDISQLISESKDPGKRFQLRSEVRKLILYEPDDEASYSIFDTHGKLLGGDEKLPLMPAPLHDQGSTYYSFSTIQGKLMRVVTTATDVKVDTGLLPVWIQVAETLHKRTRLANQILIGIVVPQLVLVLTTASLLWFGIGRGLLPLWALQNAVARRSYRDLSPVELPDIPDEVRALVDSVNFLMKELESVLQSQNRFVADAAHQLRTPLAGMQAQLELVQQENDPLELQAGLARIGSSMGRLSHLINQLLVLARNQPEVTRAIDLGAMDLIRLAQEVTTDMVPAALQKDIDLGFESLHEGIVIEGEPKRLKEMLYNLVDNAILYTQHGGKVTVSASCQNKQATLSVEDNGPGIPIAERDKVFERFHRVIGNEQEGSGLGLAIVMEIAQIHHAKVTMETPDSGVGTRVGVIFDILS